MVILGCFIGTSVLGILPWVREREGHLYCVDWFRGSPSDPPRQEFSRRNDVCALLRHRIADAGFQDCASVIAASGSDASRIWADESLDAWYLDADHRRSCVERDLREWLPKIKTGGLLFGHDFERPLSKCDPKRVAQCEEMDFVDGVHYGVISGVTAVLGDVGQLENVWWKLK